jgi:hypothetical protein
MIKYAIAAIFAFGLIILVLVAGIPKAKAEDWPYTEFSKTVAVVRATTEKRRRYKRPRVYRKHKRRHTHGTHPATVVRAWKNLDGFKNRECARAFDVAGEIKATEERAKDSAWHQWHGIVKFHLGERFADIQHAKNAKFECARGSSETLTQKTLEALGQDIYRYRCSLVATACKPPETK